MQDTPRQGLQTHCENDFILLFHLRPLGHTFKERTDTQIRSHFEIFFPFLSTVGGRWLRGLEKIFQVLAPTAYAMLCVPGQVLGMEFLDALPGKRQGLNQLCLHVPIVLVIDVPER